MNILEEAQGIVAGRRNTHGEPEDCFERVASMWSAWLGTKLSAQDVAMMMVLLKVARGRDAVSRGAGVPRDTLVDIAGYAACAWVAAPPEHVSKPLAEAFPDPPAGTRLLECDELGGRGDWVCEPEGQWTYHETEDTWHVTSTGLDGRIRRWARAFSQDEVASPDPADSRPVPPDGWRFLGPGEAPCASDKYLVHMGAEPLWVQPGFDPVLYGVKILGNGLDEDGFCWIRTVEPEEGKPTEPADFRPAPPDGWRFLGPGEAPCLSDVYMRPELPGLGWVRPGFNPRTYTVRILDNGLDEDGDYWARKVEPEHVPEPEDVPKPEQEEQTPETPAGMRPVAHPESACKGDWRFEPGQGWLEYTGPALYPIERDSGRDYDGRHWVRHIEPPLFVPAPVPPKGMRALGPSDEGRRGDYRFVRGVGWFRFQGDGLYPVDQLGRDEAGRYWARRVE